MLLKCKLIIAIQFLNYLYKVWFCLNIEYNKKMLPSVFNVIQMYLVIN